VILAALLEGAYHTLGDLIGTQLIFLCIFREEKAEGYSIAAAFRMQTIVADAGSVDILRIVWG
jgi:hypothetical protein